ncbi:MAG TPA: EAL domain-containing protein [Spirochaetia bacterium]|nr:EAL domain-containing protein [Spirochaetia bacterium]
MLIFTAITLVAFVFAIVQGTYVIVKNPRAQANRLFSIFSVLFSLWFIGTAFQLSSATEEAARLWFRIGTLGWYFIEPLFVHFILALTEDRFTRKHRWFAPLLYVPAIILTCFNLLTNVGTLMFVRTGIGWTYDQDFKSAWTALTSVYAVVYILSGPVILFRWSRKSSDPQRAAQSRIIIFSLLAGMASYGATILLSSVPALAYLPSISHIFVIVWLAGVAFAILRHKLLSISPTEAAMTIFTTMADGVLLIDREGKIANANPAACEILRVPASSLVGSSVDGTLPSVFIGDHSSWGTAHSVRDLETTYDTGDGKTVYLSVTTSADLDGSGDRQGTVMVFRDITERKQVENQLHHMATHDVLTGLPNRTLMNDRLKNALLRAQRHTNQLCAVLFIDLDKFKDINDRYGHDSGDFMLKEAGLKLTRCVREYDTVCRLGGDEFVVLLTDLADQRSCEIVIKRIQAAFRVPLLLESLELTITLSIGVSFYPLNADTPEDLFKFADIALYRVKSTGRNGYQFYSSDLDSETRKTESLEKDLAEALGRNEFEIYYQPIYDLATNRPASMEALLRWNHPVLGMVRPLDFIPIAERTGSIVPIGEWVLRDACRQLREWQKTGREITLAVNLSARQFQDPDLAAKITAILNEYAIEPRLIELEFTESTAMVDVERTVETVRKLKERGIQIVIDDFGSGFSSLAWLKHLHPKALKIDKFFIQNVGSDSNDSAIVKAIVTMAHSMGMRVIAEGIESKTQLDALRSMQWERSTDLACDGVQGFLYSQPVPASKAVQFLGSGAATPRT